MPVRFHEIGRWMPGQISVRWCESTRAQIPEVQSAIARVWDDALSRPGMRLFDGPMCRMESWERSARNLKLRLSRTSYRTFFGTNLVHPQFADAYGPQCMSNPLGVSPALITSDG